MKILININLKGVVESFVFIVEGYFRHFTMDFTLTVIVIRLCRGFYDPVCLNTKKTALILPEGSNKARRAAR